MQYSDTVILVFAKAPIAGQVNTRLIPDIGEQKATNLQYEMIHQRLLMLVQKSLCDVILMCAPNTEHEVFKQCEKKYSIRLLPQTGADLGERMFTGIKQALENFKYCIVVGTDAPALDGDKIKQAIDKLHESRAGNADVVFVPAEDGGYVLVGMSRVLDYLFTNISWGGDKVMQQSKAKLDETGVSYAELEECWDIDCLADYQRYLLLK